MVNLADSDAEDEHYAEQRRRDRAAVAACEVSSEDEDVSVDDEERHDASELSEDEGTDDLRMMLRMGAAAVADTGDPKGGAAPAQGQKRKRAQEPDEYEVETITAHRPSKKAGSKTEYHVLWKGYPHTDGTWETSAHLANSRQKIEEYRQRRREDPDRAQETRRNLLRPLRISSHLALVTTFSRTSGAFR